MAKPGATHGQHEDDDDEEQELVGYLDEPADEAEKHLFSRLYFPSKVGGRPSWLVPRHLPDVSCKKCGQRLRFLLQVYASQGEQRENCFHRTLHLLVCTNCQPSEARVFRAQLSRENPYYSSEKPNYKALRKGAGKGFVEEPDEELKALCCMACGLPGGSSAEACADCARRLRNKDPPCVFDERGITVSEACWPDEDDEEVPAVEGEDEVEGAAKAPEPPLLVDASSSNDEEVMKKLKEYQDKLAAEPDAALDKSEERVFQELMNERTVRDDAFSRFMRFSSENPQHVLRYELGGKPLWFCQPKQLRTEPPACSCGAKRQFELQVQPQLISLLRASPCADRLDYGTIVVYSCSESCEPKDEQAPYIEEFVYVQPEPTSEWIPK